MLGLALFLLIQSASLIHTIEQTNVIGEVPIIAAPVSKESKAFDTKVSYFLSNTPVGCEYFPCDNGGTCIQLEKGEYTCKCPSLYGGKNCEIALTTCTCKGATHCRTFDAANLNYPGKCRFLLSRYNGPKTISVYAHRRPHSYNPDVVYIGGLDLQFDLYNLTFTIEELVMKVKVNSINVELPYSVRGGNSNFDIFPVTTHSVRFVADNGFRVDFHRAWYVKVVVPTSFGKQMTGLCGNMDGLDLNDWSLKDGTIVKDMEIPAILVGNSYVEDLHKTFEQCQLHEAPLPPPCSLDTLFGGNIACAYLVPISSFSYLFKNCLNVFDAAILKKFHDICIEDLSMTCDVQAAKDVVRVFATACNSNGLELPEWTEKLEEPCKCPGLKQTCSRWSSGCIETCQSLLAPQSLYKPYGRCILESYNSVCVCPDETVYHNGSCIPASACGCIDGVTGVVYPLKATWLNGDCSLLHTCVSNGRYETQDFACANDKFCVAGTCKSCTPSKCKHGECIELNSGSFCLCHAGFDGEACENELKKLPVDTRESASCVCTAGQQCTTFDGVQLDYQGDCKYILISHPSITVHVSSIFRSNTLNLSYPQSVEIRSGRNVVVLQKKGFSGSAVVQTLVNDIPVEVPFESTEGFSILHNGDAVEMRDANGVSISYTHKWRVKATVPKIMSDKLRGGVCGNFDGDPVNDYTTATGENVMELHDPGVRVIESFVLNCPEKKEIQAPQEECTDTPTHKCMIILEEQGPFRNCLTKMGKQKAGHFALDCVKDVRRSCNDLFACESLENFAKICQEAGSTAEGNWREAVTCPMGCSDPSMSRAVKTTACRSTCANLPCKVVPNVATDICICPAGKTLFDGSCVLPKDCGCVDENGSARQLEATWLTNGCHVKKSCGANGVVQQQIFRCPIGTTCNGETCSSCSKNICKNGGTCHDLNVDGGKLCKCSYGFSGADCSVACNDKMDTVIVIDNTQSQCTGDPTFDGDTCDRWKKVLDYVAKIITYLQIGSPDNNIAIVKLSATPALIGRGFVNSLGLLKLLKETSISFDFEEANVAAALKIFKKSVFTTSFDRPSASNHVLFILNSWKSLNSEVSEELEALKELGARFTAVVTSEKVNEKNIKNLVQSESAAERKYFIVPSVNAIEMTKKHVQKSFNLCAAEALVTCSCVGDGRCNTFDNLDLEYKGFCRFLMMQHKSSFGEIEVWLKNTNPFPTGYNAFADRVEIIFNGRTIVLERLIKSIGSLVNLFVDGVEKSIPYAEDDFYAFYNGDAVEVSTSLDISVSLSKLYYAKVIVNPTFKNEVQGFCGNYDGNTKNDLALKGGTQLSVSSELTTVTAATMIGDSWADNATAIDGKCSDSSLKPVCRLYPLICKLLTATNKVFAPCALKYPKEAKAYQARCEEDLLDLCVSPYKAECQVFAEFDRFCQSKGIVIDWRTATQCPCLCPPEMQCAVKASACLPTCSNPNAITTCLLPDAADTCTCPEGKVLFNQRCISPSLCGCTDHYGKDRAIGESWTTENCTKKHTCDGPKSISVSPYGCKIGSNCEKEKCVGCKRPMDILFLVDESGSVCSGDKKPKHDQNGFIIGCDSWTYVLQAMANILKDLEIGPEMTQVGLIKFATRAELVWNLDVYKTKPSLLTALEQLSYGGGLTNMAAALRIARTEVFNSPADRPYAENLMIFITDGKATIEISELPVEAFKMQMMDIKNVAIGITDSIDKLSLMTLSDPPHELNSNYFVATGFDEVEFLRKKLQENIGICPDKNNYVCECWGDVYCKTFDGKVLEYNAICKTSMSLSSSLNYPFNVFFNVHRPNTTSELPYVNYVELLLGEDVIKMLKVDSQWLGPLIVTHNGDIIEVPYSNKVFSLTYYGEYLEFKTPYGLVLGFSDRSNFYMKLPKTLSYSVKGLCGNFDDDATNDILTSNNKVPSDTENPGIEVGNSFLAYDESLKPSCKATIPPILDCPSNLQSMCTHILSKTGPFGSCIFMLEETEVGNFFQQCLNDYKRTCLRESTCRSLEAFARKCRSMGWKEEVVSKWRTDVKCSCACQDADMHCRPFGPPCLNTCANPNAADTCKEASIQDVCVCKDPAKVLQKGKCVDISECGCIDKAGKARKVGDEFLEEACTLSSKCVAANTVQSNQYVCPDNNQCFKNKCTPCEPVNPCLNGGECQVKQSSKFLCKCKEKFYGRTCERERKTGVCRLWTGVGIATFDQALLDYDGLNKYLLTTGVFDKKDFSVFAKNFRACTEEGGQTTKIRYVEFVWKEYTVHLEKDGDAAGSPVVAVVNGVWVSIPYKNALFAISYVGEFVEIKSFFGLIVAFSNTHKATVQLPSISPFTSNMKGVCGNFDDKDLNDYRTSQGADVYDTFSMGATIVNSYEYLVPNKENDPKVFDLECFGEAILDQSRCRSRPEKCDLIKKADGPFMWCVQQLKPEVVDKFVETCKKNYQRTCKANDFTLEASVCESMQAFVWLCQGSTGWTEKNIAPDWRSELNCPCSVDNPTMKCKPEAPSCLPTCSEPQAAAKCNLPATFYGPSCINEKHVLFQGNCVDPKACGCVDDDKGTRKVGDVWIKSDCTSKQTCTAGGLVTKEAFSCKTTSTCLEGKCIGCGESIKVTFLLDNNVRSCEIDWPFVVQFLADMVKLMRIEESTSAISLLFAGSSVQKAINLNDFASTKNYLGKIKDLKCPSKDATAFNLVSALQEINKGVVDDSRMTPDHLIILTSSSSFNNEHLINGEMYRLKVRKVNVVSVGIGSEVHEDSIRALSSTPSIKNKNFFMLSNHTELGPLRKSLQESLQLCADTKPVKCSCFGDVHCSTFDNLHLSYQGSCKFLLAESSSVFQEFKVFLKGTSINGFNSKTVVELLEIHLKTDVIVMKLKDKTKKSPVQALVNNKPVGIPSKFADFQLQLNGRYSELVTSFGLVVALSPDWRSYVQVPRTFSHATKGFCGDYDDVMANDKVTASGEEAKDGTGVADSYLVDSNDASCLTDPQPTKTCDLVDQPCSFIADVNGPFSACIKATSEAQIVSYANGCIFDYTTTCKQEAACNMLETIAEVCRRNHGEASVSADWRDVVKCPCQCLDQATQTCVSKGPACIDTCDDMKASQSCSLPPAFDVCRCKDAGQVFFQGQCIEKERCGCKDERDQSIHEIGSVWLDEECMEESKCEGNKVISRKRFECPTGTTCHDKTCTACRPNPCQNEGKCTDVDADKYVCQCPPAFYGVNCEIKRKEYTCVCQDGVLCRTFGGVEKYFSSNKAWLLAEEIGKFKVVGKAYKMYAEDGQPQDSYFRFVEVTLGEWKVHFEWDDLERTLFSSISTSLFCKDLVKRVQIPYKGQDFDIDWKGRFLRLESKAGVSISVSSKGIVAIGVEASSKHAVAGFCGGLDGSEGEDERPGEEFIVSEEVYEVTYEGGKRPRPVGKRECALTTSECAKVLSKKGAFYQCWNRLDKKYVDALIERCGMKVNATCDTSVVCDFAQELALRCAEVVGVESVKEWRSENQCPCQDRNDVKCSPLGPACINTCSQPSAVSSCKDDVILDSYACVEPDHVLSPGGACVSKDACGCVDEEGGSKELQHQWLTTDCLSKSKCKSPNVTVSQEHQCSANAKCNKGFCYGCDKPLDVVFIMDESDSVCQHDPTAVSDAFSVTSCDNFKQMQTFVVDLVKYFDTRKVNVALLKYSDQVTTVYALKSALSKEELVKRTQEAIYLGGVTNSANALRKARTELVKEGCPLAPDVIVLLMSEAPEVADYRFNHELFEARIDGIKVFLVGVESGKEATKAFLQAVSKADDIFEQKVLVSESFEELFEIEEQLEEILGLCGAKTATCACMGGRNCYTFDSAPLSHSTFCPFTLLKSRQVESNLEVILERKKNPDVQILRVAQMGYLIELENHHLLENTIDLVVKVNGKAVEVPYGVKNIFNIYYNAMAIEVEVINEGLVARMGPLGNIAVILDSNRQVDFSGFCGNYDGDAANDYVKSDGTSVPVSESAGGIISDSYIVKEETENSCTTELDDLTDVSNCQEAAKKCESLKTLSFYAECQALMGESMRNFHSESCSRSVMLATCSEQVVCEIAESFVARCRQSGVSEDKLKEWRTTMGCPCQCADKDKQCIKGRSTACPKTCSPLDGAPSGTCTLGEAWDVCACKEDNHVLFKGRCVEPAQCGCVSTEDGASYELNSSWLNDDCSRRFTCQADRRLTNEAHACPSKKQCFERECYFCKPTSPCVNDGECIEERDNYYCKCKNGFFGRNCEKKKDVAMCSCWSGTTCQTFDGATWPAVTGLSRFQLVSSTNAKCPFKVFVKNYRPCDDPIAVPRYVEIEFADQKFRIEKLDPTSTTSLISTYVNGAIVALPLTTEQYSITYRGHSVLFESSCGFDVSFSGPPLHVKVPTYLTSKVTGLCGNFDDVIPNDLPPSPSSFNQSDADVHEPEEAYDYLYDECISTTFPPCDNHNKTCEKIKDGKKFGTCLKLLDAVVIEGFYRSCQTIAKDGCATKIPIEQLLCEVQRQFAENCEYHLGFENDVVPLFHAADECACPFLHSRSPLKCEAKSNSCQNTCLFPDAEKRCEKDESVYNVLKCSSPGQLLFKGACVEARRCGCVDGKGRAKEIGETWLEDSCGVVKECTGPNTVVDLKHQCTAPDICTGSHCHGCDQAKDVFLLMQTSASICQNDATFDASARTCRRFKQLLSLLADTLLPLDLSKSDVTLISFADVAKLEFGSRKIKDQKSLAKAIKDLKVSDKAGANLNNALELLQSALQSKVNWAHVSKHVIIVTTSAFSGNERDKAGVSMRLDRLKLAGTNIVSLGALFDQPLPKEMVRSYASAPNKLNKNYFYLESFSDQFKVRSGIEENLLICDTKPAKCSCFGDVHCSTFDNLHLSYQGSCKFLLAEYPNSALTTSPEDIGLPGFEVALKGFHRFGDKCVTWADMLEVLVFDQVIQIRKLKNTDISPVVAFVDGIQVVIPSKFENFSFRFNGAFTELVTSFGLVVAMSTTWRTYVEVPRSYAFLTHGFCGNFDGDKFNDWALSNGTSYTNRKDLGVQIGDSYVIQNVKDKSESCFEHPQIDDPEKVCFLNSEKCDSLSSESGLFAECYKLFKEQRPEQAESFTQNCLFDLSSICKERTHCNVVEQYVDECRSLAGGESVVPDDWREKMMCSCECNDEDQKCAKESSACINSCSKPDAVDTCELPRRHDTCVCKDPDHVVFQGKCVAKEACGCYDDADGTEHKVNSTWISRDCLQVSTCDAIGNISRQAFQCPDGTSCYINRCTACQPDPCLNGGECFDAKNNRFKCTCPRGFAGERCGIELSTITCRCVKGALCETFDGYELLNTNVGKWTLFKAKLVKVSDGVPADSNTASGTPGKAIYSEVEVRARNVKDCGSGEVWIQYVEVLIAGYTVRLEKILGGKVAPARATVNGIEVSVPYKSPGLAYNSINAQTSNNKLTNLPPIFEITFYASYIRVSTKFGLQVEFNSLGVASLHALVSAAHLSGSANVNGFCGNNDGVLFNDAMVAGKSQVMVDAEYDWSLGNKLAEFYAVDIGDEILGNCSIEPKDVAKTCEVESPCVKVLKDDSVFAHCLWTIDEHLVELVRTKCQKRWKSTCDHGAICTLFEDLAAICAFKVPQESFKDWRNDSGCPCDTGLKELSCKVWGSPCNAAWQVNPLMCIDTPTYDTVFCNSISRYPGPCGPRDCIDNYGSGRLFGEEWLSEDCGSKYKCTDQGIVWKEEYTCPALTECLSAHCIGCDSPKDILIMIDESSSICGNEDTCDVWEAILMMIHDVIKIVDISTNKTRVGLIKFSTEARIVFDLGQFFTKKSLLESIVSLKSVGGVSNLGEALTVARRDVFEKSRCTGKRGLVPDVLVLITDGNVRDYDDQYHVINHEVFNLRLLDVRTVVLGLTTDLKYTQLLPLISSRPHKEHWDYFLLTDVEAIEKAERSFTDSISHCEFQTSTCRCVGNFHCTTFDHAHLSFTSQCPFLLTELDLLGHPIRVVVTNSLDMEGMFSPQMVDVEWSDVRIRLTNEYQAYKPITGVYVREVSVEVPYVRPNISIQYFGMNVEVVLGTDEKVVLVGIGAQGTVYVKVPYRMQLQVKGFCGNYDNDYKNDFLTASLEDVSNTEEPGRLVGESFAVKTEGTDVVACEAVAPPKPCDAGLQKCLQLIGKSSTNQFYLPECNEKLSAESLNFYHRACLSSFGPKCLSKVACKVIGSYVEECRLAGVEERILFGWKQLFDCPCGCDNRDMLCVADSRSCVETCPNPSLTTYPLIRTTEQSRQNNDTCKMPKGRDMCQCAKEGQKLFKGRCVEPAQCGCVSEVDGQSYELNTTWLSLDCAFKFVCQPTHSISKTPYKCPHSMQCNEGMCSVCYPKSPCQNYGKCEELGNGAYKCICRAGFYGKNCDIKTESCLLHGNGHAKTFDWAALEFRSSCKFLLAKSVTADNLPYEVYAKYQKRQVSFFILYVEVVYAGHVVRLLRREVDGKDLLVATINGIQVNNLPVRNKHFSIYYANRKMLYETRFGLVVSLTRSWIAEVALTAQVKNLSGYCGNFDGDKENDFVTKKGDSTKDDKNPGDRIGLSYVVENDPERVVGEKCEAEVLAEVTITPKEGVKLCSIIKNSECASRLDEFIVRRFEFDCVEDYGTGCSVKDQQVYCQNIETFADLCQGIGFPLVDWMKDSNCACSCVSPAMQCVSSQVTSSCVPTCGQANAIETCALAPAHDSCSCGPGNVLHDGECISALMCQCVDNMGLDRKLGEVWYDEDCTTKFVCTGPGSVTSQKATTCAAQCMV